MGLDIKLPIGLLFSILGLLLLFYGLGTMSNTELYKASLGINMNIWWGLVMTIFGGIMLYLAKKPKKIKKEGDEIKIGQRIVEIKRKNLLEQMNIQNYIYDSPVRGRVEKINYEAGTIILREIQDYSTNQ